MRERRNDVLGPVEYVNVQADSLKSLSLGAAALGAAASRELIHIVDLVFVERAADGSVTTTELDDADEDTKASFAAVSGEYGGLLSEDDIAGAAATLQPGTSCLLLVWENLWAKELFGAFTDAGARVITDLHISPEVAEPAYSSLPAA